MQLNVSCAVVRNEALKAAGQPLLNARQLLDTDLKEQFLYDKAAFCDVWPKVCSLIADDAGIAIDTDYLLAEIEAEFNAAVDLLKQFAPEIKPATQTNELVTLADAANLLMLDEQTLKNRRTSDKKQGRIWPEPTIYAKGNQPNRFSYPALRPHLIEAWPDLADRLPADFEEAKRLLSRDEVSNR